MTDDDDGRALFSSSASCVVITGASRGLGRAIAVEFAKLSSVRSLVLIARSSSGLEATREECLDQHQLLHQQRTAKEDEVEEDCLGTYGGTLNVITIEADLGKLATLDETIDRICETVVQQLVEDEHDFGRRLILVNNAGSLGYIGRAAEIPSLQVIQGAIDLNVTSALWMAVRMTSSTLTSTNVLIVNISSLVAVQPFPSLALYSAGKAARDAFLNAMATEQPPTSTGATTTTNAIPSARTIKTLNYAPGPLETDMTQEIREASSSERLDASLRHNYAQQLVLPADSARVLVDLVQKDEFKSGQHIDYFDLVVAQKQQQ